LQSEIAFFQKIEADAIKELHSYGPAILNHNDLTALNVILGDDGLIRIVDWENASLGPPGASLRKFANHDPVKRRRIAELYSGYMTNFGIPLRPDDVLRVMQGQQAFWYLAAGLRRHEIWRIKAGLQLARSTFGENGSIAC
jgi:thiamine kinase-like enzyme